jgi:hypothetical protein
MNHWKKYETAKNNKNDENQSIETNVVGNVEG